MRIRLPLIAPSTLVGLHEEVCPPLCVGSGVALGPTQPEALTSLVQVQSQAPLKVNAHEVHIAEHLLGM